MESADPWAASPKRLTQTRQEWSFYSFSKWRDKDKLWAVVSEKSFLQDRRKSRRKTKVIIIKPPALTFYCILVHWECHDWSYRKTVGTLTIICSLTKVLVTLRFTTHKYSANHTLMLWILLFYSNLYVCVYYVCVQYVYKWYVCKYVCVYMCVVCMWYVCVVCIW